MRCSRVPASGLAAVLLCCLLLLSAGGCQSRAPAHRVKGKVTFKGQAVATGTVAFHGLEDWMPMARGELRSDGSYELTTYREGDGAPAGKYQVTVHAFTPGRGVEGQDADYRPPQPLVPLRYTRLDLTPLTATVESKDNVIDLDLKP